MSRARRETLAILAAERRDDARADTLVRLGNRAAPYKGHTSHTIDGCPTFAARVGGFQNKMRLGRNVRGKFVPDRDAPVSRGMTKGDE